MGNWINLNSARYHLVKPTGSELQECSTNLIKYHKDHSQSVNQRSMLLQVSLVGVACFQGPTIEVSKVGLRNFFYVHLRQVHIVHHPESQRESYYEWTIVNINALERPLPTFDPSLWLAPKSVRVRGNLITLTNFKLKVYTYSRSYELSSQGY